MATKPVQKPYALLIEPFYGGSHKQLIDVLMQHFDNCILYSLPAKKWHWRARTSALWFAQNIPLNLPSCEVLFASAVLNMAELIALRPDFQKLKKVLYFHENQLVYPTQEKKDRDFQYGYNQILSSLVADEVVFNSKFNMDSFLSNVSHHLKLMPDHRPKDLVEKLKPKCKVIYFPALQFSVHERTDKTPYNAATVTEIVTDIKSSNHNMDDTVATTMSCTTTSLDLTKGFNNGRNPLHIVWAHRWEHDKNPELFFKTLFSLKEDKHMFRVSVLGEVFSEVPAIFEEAKQKLGETINHWGFLPSKNDYWNVLKEADVAVSTAVHEFLGVSMIEAAEMGCYVLCPNRLVYPEVFSGEHLYNTESQLLKKLRSFCQHPQWSRKSHKYNLDRFRWPSVQEEFSRLLQPDKARCQEVQENC